MTKIEYELKFVARSFPFSSMDKRLVTSKPSLKKIKGKKQKPCPLNTITDSTTYRTEVGDISLVNLVLYLRVLYKIFVLSRGMLYSNFYFKGIVGLLDGKRVL